MSGEANEMVKDMDRFAELANIGAGHAVTAFSQLTGHTIRMRAPRYPLDEVRDVPLPPPMPVDRGWTSGVLFELEGCVDALVGILFRPEMSEAVLARKLDALAAADPDVIATGNPGCLMQIARGVRERGLRARVVHPVELLDAAYGDG